MKRLALLLLFVPFTGCTACKIESKPSQPSSCQRHGGVVKTVTNDPREDKFKAWAICKDGLIIRLD